MHPSIRKPTARRSSAGRVWAVAIFLAVALSAALGISGAFASSVKPGKYRGPESFQGTKSTTEFVTFTVNKSKTKVTKLRLVPFVANKCGSGGPPPKENSKPAKIKNGKFTGTVKEFDTSGSLVAKGKVTGTFKAGGKVKGSVKDTLPKFPHCNATLQFTAKVKKG
jgi:major membrane immunogen (membrane-anchored lipoprotein)